MKYEDWLAAKRLVAPMTGIADPPGLDERLFGFQADITRWALRRGRAALWEDCGMGKSFQALEWGRVVNQHTQQPVLILTPLAVASQFVREGEKFDIDVKHVREASELTAGINVTNYERLGKFDPRAFGGVVADEAGCLKDYTSATRNAMIEAWERTPFKLACTATPAPNDHVELGNQAEFLGVMSRTEMLSMFFVHDGGSTQDWRLKGHAVREFWRWVCSWAVAVRKPSDLGYEDGAFTLPPLNIHDHVVSVGQDFARKQGSLFTVAARGLTEQREARRASLGDRVAVAAAIIKAEPSEQWIAWGELNDECSRLAAEIPGSVEVSGSDTAEFKEKSVDRFLSGEIRVLVSKSSIFGWGMNMQCCARSLFIGVGNSFEAWYQAIRRVYRFGQDRAVECHMITSDAEGAVAANLRRKQIEADAMISAMVREMGSLGNVRAASRDVTEYKPTKTMKIPKWVGTEER